MKKALVFVSYHPKPLGEYDYIRKKNKGRFISVLVFCGHPYLNSEIVELYSKKFDYAIALPDVHYEANIFRGFIRLFRFLRNFKKKIKPILDNVDSFNVISDFSAYLPANAVLSELRRNKKCNRMIGIRANKFKFEVNVFKTICTMMYVCIFRLYFVYYNRKLAFMYFKKHYEKDIIFYSPFMRIFVNNENDNRSIWISYVSNQIYEDLDSNKDIIIIYGNTGLFNSTTYSCDLSAGEYEYKLRVFFTFLSQYYKDCKLLYKPHPSDGCRIMNGLENIKFELCRGGLTSEIHLDEHIDRVKACYSVNSISLLYASYRGIPSYALYKYLCFNSRYPKAYFEEGEGCKNPYLFRLERVDEIGKIDSLKIEPCIAEKPENWDILINL